MPEVLPDVFDDWPRDEDVHHDGRDERDEDDLFPPVPQGGHHDLGGRALLPFFLLSFMWAGVTTTVLPVYHCLVVQQRLVLFEQLKPINKKGQAGISQTEKKQ